MQMLIYWRYLLAQYLRIFFLSFCSFICILLTIRFDEIAEFAALGAARKPLLLFIAYQIPYITPIVVPISSLIAGLLLFNRLSSTNELTALRVCGLPLKNILSPVLIPALIFSILNFLVVSEVSTRTHLQGKKMVHELMTINPLVLLQKAQIVGLKGAYLQMEPIRNAEEAKDLLVVLKNTGCDRLNLFLAKSAFMENQKLKFENVSFISSSSSSLMTQFDHLIIENEKKAQMDLSSCTNLLKKKGWKLANDHLKLAFLKVKIKNLKTSLTNTKEVEKIQFIKKNLNKCRTDIVRRFSLALSAFTFTLLGVVFGIENNRNTKKWNILTVFCLASLALIIFFVGKEFDFHLFFAGFLFLLPHLLNITVSIWKFQKVLKGEI